jgi:hypothetical protein
VVYFTPPRHAASMARCDLFLLRRTYFGKTTFHVVALGDNGKVLTEDQLADEIGRMEKFAAIGLGKSSEYRLNDECFYLKFVKRNGLLKNGSILTPLLGSIVMG